MEQVKLLSVIFDIQNSIFKHVINLKINDSFFYFVLNLQNPDVFLHMHQNYLVSILGSEGQESALLISFPGNSYNQTCLRIVVLMYPSRFDSVDRALVGLQT